MDFPDWDLQVGGIMIWRAWCGCREKKKQDDE
jgi:hypothetical protein